MQKLVGFGDLRTSNIVSRIADEEIAHVAVGLYWFLYICQKMNRVPCSTFKGFPGLQCYKLNRIAAFQLLVNLPCLCACRLVDGV